MGYTMFDVCLFEAKNRVFEFDYQKMSTFESIQWSINDVRVCSMFNAQDVNGYVIQLPKVGNTAM